jgi:aspartate kinase
MTTGLKRVTLKFGGTSVENAERIRENARLVKRLRDQGTQVVVVTSAMAGVTDELVKLLAPAASGGAEEGDRVNAYYQFTRQLYDRHVETAQEAIRNEKGEVVEEILKRVTDTLHAIRQGLERLLLGSYLLGELPPIGYDNVVSTGERLCVPILAGAIRALGVPAVEVNGDVCGIITDNNYGNALPDDDQTRQEVRRALLPLIDRAKQDEVVTPVVTGFYGRSHQGRIAILGRGGSDYSATLIGCAIDSDEIWILKTVAGIQTTDPRLVPEARTIDTMPYAVAAEMAMLGAKVLHPRSILPAFRKGVPVRIASSINPDQPGTRLVREQEGVAGRVRALTLVRKGCLVRAWAVEMGDEGIVPPEMIGELRRGNVDVIASASGFNGGSLLWLTGPEDGDRFLRILKNYDHGYFQSEIRKPVALLGIVGQNVANSPEVHLRVTQALQEVHAQPLAMLQGASPSSLVIALPDEQESLKAVLRCLHRTLGMGAEG